MEYRSHPRQELHRQRRGSYGREAEVAGVALPAGRKAKGGAADASGGAYVGAGMALSDERKFGLQCRLTFILSVERAEYGVWTGQFGKGRPRIAECFQHGEAEVVEWG